MILAVGILIAGILLLTAGAESFVRGSSSLAAKIGLSPLVIGLTVVAFGTSAPELMVSVESAFAGSSGITAGNVIGSNIANIALILGVCALITPLRVQRQVVKRDTPFMIGLSVLCFIMLWNRQLSRFEAIALLACFFSYVVFSLLKAMKTKSAATNNNTAQKKNANIFILLLLIGGGLGSLLYGAKLLVDAGVTIARHFHVSETIIGISIIAAGTSLPELAASIMAAAKKETDIAIGNVVGSNVYNIGLVLGTAGALRPFSVHDLKTIDIGTMLLLSVLLLPFVKSGHLLNRIEGMILLVSYAGYIFFLWK